MRLDDYREAGILTTLWPEAIPRLAGGVATPEALCRIAQGLIVGPDEAVLAGLPAARLEERNIRPAAGILRRALELDDAPLGQPRTANARVVGTCRHFAVLACALLRAAEFPARARCGFATYFQPGRHVDHWVTEYWDAASARWVRLDSEILGMTLVPRPEDLAPGEFLTGGEAWEAYRGGADGMSFGVFGTENWGPAEIVGNVIRDVAALNKVEMLPWDEWGPMAACYADGVNSETGRLMDRVAKQCAADIADLPRLYEEFRVPPELVR